MIPRRAEGARIEKLAKRGVSNELHGLLSMVLNRPLSWMGEYGPLAARILPQQ